MATGRMLVSRAAILLCIAAFAPSVIAKVTEATGKRVPKQIHTKAAIINSDEDHKAAETGFGGATIGANGKYFQYAHQPEHDHYEFGHRRGNEHHFQERYEKAAPHDGHFKTKVRWGDKHGGYGEHYYDYNHGGHEAAADGGDEGGDGHYSEPVPTYDNAPTARVTAKRHLNEEITDAESAAAEQESVRVLSQDVPRLVKRQPSAEATPQEPKLVFDLASGQVIDEVTGKVYALQPVN